MTGVRAGSQGTGLVAGSQGTGVAGGSAYPEALIPPSVSYTGNNGAVQLNGQFSTVNWSQATGEMSVVSCYIKSVGAITSTPANGAAWLIEPTLIQAGATNHYFGVAWWIKQAGVEPTLGLTGAHTFLGTISEFAEGRYGTPIVLYDLESAEIGAGNYPAVGENFTFSSGSVIRNTVPALDMANYCELLCVGYGDDGSAVATDPNTYWDGIQQQQSFTDADASCYIARKIGGTPVADRGLAITAIGTGVSPVAAASILVPGPKVPVVREATWDAVSTASTAIAYDSAGLTNDRSVFLAGATTVSVGTPTDVTLTNIEGYDELKTGSGHGTVFNHPYALKAGRKTITADAEANVTLATVPGAGLSNLLVTLNRMTFIGATVTGDPVLVRMDTIDDVVPAGFTVGANSLTWPTVDIPEGHVAVYLATFGGQPSGFTWSTATSRLTGGSFTSTDSAATSATLAGPHPGTGVTLNLTGISTRISERGVFTAIYLVPGLV